MFRGYCALTYFMFLNLFYCNYLCSNLFAENNPAEARQHYSVAVKAVENTQPQEAINALWESIKADSSFLDARELLGLVYLNVGEYTLAAEQYEEFLKAQPDDADCLNNLAVCQVHLGQPKKAVTLFEKALVLDPDNANTYNQLGEISLNLGVLKEAQRYFLSALKIDPANAKAYHRLGTLYRDNNKAYEGIKLLQKSIKHEPQNTIYLTDLGLAYIQNNIFLEAVAEFDKALKIDPDFFPAYLGKGKALFELGYLDKAIESLWQAVILVPSSSDAHLALAQCYVSTKDPELLSQAAFEFGQALIDDPKNIQAYMGLADVYEMLGHQNKVFKTYETLIKTVGHYPQAVANYGLLLTQADNPQKAKDIYLACLNKRPKNSLVRSNLALLHYQQKEWHDAKQQFTAIINQEGSKNSYGQIAKIHLKEITAKGGK